MKVTKKLLVSILTAVFALVTLGTTTYAWFVTANVAKLSAIDANVKAPDGVDIAVAPINYSGDGKDLTYYSGAVPASDIMAAAMGGWTDEEKAAGFILDAVTWNGTNMKYLKGSDNAKKNSFMEFQVWFRSNAEIEIQLVQKAGNSDETATTMTGVAQDWLIDYGFKLASDNDVELEAGETTQFNVASAARTMIVTDEDAEIVLENVAEAGTVAAAGNSVGFCADGVGAVQYYNGKTGEAITAPSDYAAKALLGVETDEEKVVATLAGDETTADYTNIIVRIWVEGWDGECMNAIYNQKLTVEIGFRSVAIVPEP